MQAERSFNLNEANALLPSLRNRMGRIVKIHRRLREIQTAHRKSFNEARMRGNAPVHPGYFLGLERMQAALQGVTALGCHVKDLETGLIDFPATREGRTVFLCWRLGENQVRYWHEIDSGFAGRLPIDNDFL
ncbi:MAG: DUF2203 domain-containing protein [Acidobacteria bacterium]|nr:DUF2203 domain-containing protein [Acidobacteriota bacterium]